MARRTGTFNSGLLEEQAGFSETDKYNAAIVGMGPLNSLFSSIPVPDSVCVCDLNEA